MKILTRRDFLKSTTSAAAAGALIYGIPGKFAARREKKTRVVLVRNKDLFDKNKKLRAEIVQEMLDSAVKALLDEKDVLSAWKKIIKPDDVVGIKTNVWNYLPTTREVEEAIKRRVMDVGVEEKNISIKDRGVLQDRIFKNATALINARPMRTHYWSGVGSLIKNYIQFSERPFKHHPDSCADLATIWKKPIVKDKTRLNILVMFTPLFHGMGPHHFNSEYTWPYNGILVGFDPVAVDSTGLRIILAKRKEYFKEDRPLNPPAKHIFLADKKYKLGTSDPQKIEIIKLGWGKNILI